MAESNINVTPGSGGPNIDLEIVDNGNSRQVICVGDPTTGTKVAPVDATLGLSVNVTNSTSPLPSGAATATNQTNVIGSASGGTAAVDSLLSGGQFNTVLPTLTNTQQAAIQLDSSARAIIAPLTSTSTVTVVQSTAASLNTNVSGTITANQGSANATPWNENLTQCSGAALDLGQEISTACLPVVIASDQSAVQISQTGEASNLCQSATAATGTGVTVTLPAVASNFHYITLIEIHKYFTVANAASATPLVVTTTNLPGSLAFTFGQPLGTVGSTDERVYTPATPLKSSVLNTATTIVCPATTGIIWRINVFYFVAP
jgi:hypothetical protein